MCIFEVAFNRVKPGEKFCIENPDYDSGNYPNCGPLLMECVRLVSPTENGFNTVDDKGRFHKIADEDKVVITYGYDR